ncbi:holo-ACP synthase [Acidobacteriia bacterium AH_259_A11_L15]|nr:holo-ACP synthase [Acidobacteriia bacterium AH_259_A11_L15]
MIVGLGIDIAEPARIREAAQRYGRRFLERVFTPKEIAYCERKRNKWERYAARFAAKEAAFKALGTGWKRGVRWLDVEVTNQPGGRPTLALFGQAREFARRQGVREIFVSLSHAEQFVFAQVIFEK